MKVSSLRSQLDWSFQLLEFGDLRPTICYRGDGQGGFTEITAKLLILLLLLLLLLHPSANFCGGFIFIN